MRARFSALVLLLIAAPLRPVLAEGSDSGFPLLTFGISARNAAMADAVAASATGALSLATNPGGLAAHLGDAESAGLYFTHREWFADTRSDHLSGWVALNDVSAIGLSLSTLTTGEIDVRTRPGPPEGSFSARSFTAAFSYGRHLGATVSVGASLKVLYEKLLVDDATGFAVDAGMQWIAPVRGLTVGLAVANIGGMSALRSASTTLPTTARAGGAYGGVIDSSFAFTLGADVSYIIPDGEAALGLGGEFVYSRLIAIRAGYLFGPEARGFSAGIGLSYGIVRFDYAYVPLREDLGTTHALTLGVSF